MAQPGGSRPSPLVPPLTPGMPKPDMVGLRTYYVPPRLVGSIRHWSGINNRSGVSPLLRHAAGLGFNSIWLGAMSVATRRHSWRNGVLRAGNLYATRDHFALDPEISSAPRGIARRARTPWELEEIDRTDRVHLAHFCKTANDGGMRVIADLVCQQVAADHPMVLQEDAEIAALTAHCRENGLDYRRIRATDDGFEIGGSGIVVGLAMAARRFAEPLPLDLDKHVVDSPFAKLPHAYYFRFHRGRDLSLELGDIGPHDGEDVAVVNYHSPAAIAAFVTGEDGRPGLWKQVIDWYLDLGFTGFRCDVAHAVPAYVWDILLDYARRRHRDTVFIADVAEATGDQLEKIATVSTITEEGERPGFDVGMIGVDWNNLVSSGFLDRDMPLIEHATDRGIMGFADNHDTTRTIPEELFQRFGGRPDVNRIVRATAFRNYALALMLSNSSFMPMGFEYCKSPRAEMFRGAAPINQWRTLQRTRGDDDHPLNLTKGVMAVNQLKAALGVEECQILIPEFDLTTDECLGWMRVAYIDREDGAMKTEVMIMVNLAPEEGPVAIDSAFIKNWTRSSSFIRSFARGGGGTDMVAWSMDGDVDTERRINIVHDILILHMPIGRRLSMAVDLDWDPEPVDRSTPRWVLNLR